MDEEERKKYPYLPPDYVSLAQLKERWLQKQEEERNENEKRKKQEEIKSSAEAKKRENENDHRNAEDFRDRENEKKIEAPSVGYEWRQRLKKDEQEMRLKIGGSLVDGKMAGIDKGEKKKKKRYRSRKKFRAVGENGGGDTERVVIENEEEKDIPENGNSYNDVRSRDKFEKNVLHGAGILSRNEVVGIPGESSKKSSVKEGFSGELQGTKGTFSMCTVDGLVKNGGREKIWAFNRKNWKRQEYRGGFQRNDKFGRKEYKMKEKNAEINELKGSGELSSERKERERTEFQRGVPEERNWNKNGYRGGFQRNDKYGRTNKMKEKRVEINELKGSEELASEKKETVGNEFQRWWVPDEKNGNQKGFGDGFLRNDKNGRTDYEIKGKSIALDELKGSEELASEKKEGERNEFPRNSKNRGRDYKVKGHGVEAEDLNGTWIPPEKVADEVSVGESERNDAKEGVVNGFRRKENRIGKIERKFGNMTLNDGKVGNLAKKVELNGVGKRRYGNSGRFSNFNKSQTHIGVAWVKRREISDANAAEIGFSAEEPQPHPVLEQLTGVQYCINSPPPLLEAIILGFQHYVLSLGSIVLIPSMTVPQMGGSEKEKAKVIQTLLFVSGVNTLFHSLFGTRLPVVIGGSHAFLIPVTTILRSRRHHQYSPEERFAQTMREIQGALIITSCFQMIIGFMGLWRNMVRLFSPLSMVPLVLFTSLGLYHLGFPLIANCVEVGIPELVSIIIISQYLPRFIKLKRPLCDRFAVLFSIAIVWIYAGILTWSGAYHKPSKDSCRTDHSGLISGAPWIYVPLPFQWGRPTFRAGEIFATVMASLVASTESTGVYLAAARYGSATPVPPSVISRGIGWLGIGTLLNGLFGSVTGATATAENAGLLALTKAGSRRVVQISAAFMIFFSFLGKFGAIFAAIPLPIMAGIYCICFGYVASAGLGFLQFCNLNNFRTKLILGFSIFLGLSLSQHFREYHQHSSIAPIHTHATWFNDIMCILFMSHATVAAIVALVLDSSLPHGSDEAHKDNGAYWWERFMVYNKDVRNNEFYKLPGQLNNLFPAF